MKYSRVLFAVSAVVFFLSLWLYWDNRFWGDISQCTSHTTLVHGTLRVDARYDFAMSRGKGVIRINGNAIVDNKKLPISRQVQFIYSHIGDTYTLENTQSEIMSNDKGNLVNIQEHFPSFFSVAGRRLTIVMQLDRYKNYIMYFGNVPVFYCVKSSGK